MAIKAPEGTKPVKIPALDQIMAVRELAKGAIQKLSDAAIKTLRQHRSRYGETDSVIAHLRGVDPAPAKPADDRGPVDVHKLWKLVKAGDLDERDFLDSVAVDKVELGKHLVKKVIDQLCPKLKPTPPPEPKKPYLAIEFKRGFELSVEAGDVGELLGPVTKRVIKRAHA